MAGAIDKKKNEVVEELENAPVMHIDARMSILSDIGLSREFAQTYLNAICQKFTSSTGSHYTIAGICEALADQRVICYGATSLKGAPIRKFTFPTYEVVNGALGLTEANTSYFGFVCTDLSEDNTITLQNTAGTQTIDGNTFSVQITDYYLARSRISGEIESTSGNLSAYTTPDQDVAFGTAVAWGSSVAGEEAANTWNYHWARANLASTAVSGAGTVYALNVMTLADHLTQGSNTDYTPLGPTMGAKYFLKRHADAVNTFSIIGTTTANSIDISSVSDTDLAKVKGSDIISGTGIPVGAGGPPKIVAALTKKNRIRMGNITYTTGTVGQLANVVTLSGGTWPSTVEADSVVTISGGGGSVVTRDSDTQVTIDNSASVSVGTGYSMSYPGKATATGTVTLTVNSIPVGHAAHDIFCQIEISAEGLVANSTWTPVGDLAGTYAAASEDDLCVANTSDFIAKLGFFNPDNAANATSNNELTKGASALYSSEGKEYNGTEYPDIEKNPFKPATGGTTKAYELKEGVIVGTQPSGLTEKDLWSGRFIRWDKERANSAGPMPEFRYITDSAERFYYAPQANATYTSGTDTVASHPMPNTTEPRAILPRTGLSDAITRIQSSPVTVPTYSATIIGGDVPVSAAAAVPADGDTTNPTLAGNVPNQPAADTTIGTYYTLNGNYIYSARYHIESISITTVASPGVNTWVASTASDLTIFPCRYNYVQRHLFDQGGSSNSTGGTMTTANDDIDHIQTTVDDLQARKAFRDPIITGAHAGGSGLSDAAFDTAITSEPEGDLASCAESLYDFRVAWAAQNRTGPNNSNSNKGSSISYANTTWALLHTELTTFGTNCTKRIAEIDARIGVPTYAYVTGSTPAAVNNPPTIKVSAIPASNTTGGQVPYGRSLYNNVNMLLGQDVDLLGGIIKDIEGLSNLVDMVKTARNKYEIYSGRDREYS